MPHTLIIYAHFQISVDRESACCMHVWCCWIQFRTVPFSYPPPPPLFPPNYGYKQTKKGATCFHVQDNLKIKIWSNRLHNGPKQSNVRDLLNSHNQLPAFPSNSERHVSIKTCQIILYGSIMTCQIINTEIRVYRFIFRDTRISQHFYTINHQVRSF